jgi:hypothetical protein
MINNFSSAAGLLRLLVATAAVGCASAVLEMPAESCIKETYGEACYNLTAAENPWYTWAGYVCLEMPKSKSLTVTLDSAVYWKFYENAAVWIGDDPKDIPLLPDGTADLAKFPYLKKNLFKQDTVEFDVTLDSAKITKDCQGKSEYKLSLAAYGYISEPCHNGSAMFGNEWDAWGEDIDNTLSVSDEVTYIEVPIDCECFKEDETTKSPGGSGDPHITMWSGEKYDFQGGCDLVLLDYVSIWLWIESKGPLAFLTMPMASLAIARVRRW